MKIHQDHRGKLIEIFKFPEYQVYYVTIIPGETRGNHYHKNTEELFCVIEGEGIIVVGEKKHIVSGKEPEIIKIPTNQMHSIENTGKTELKMLAWASQPHDPNNPDTYK